MWNRHSKSGNDRPRQRTKRAAALIAAVMSLAATSVGAVSLSPAVAQLPLTPGGAVSQRVTASAVGEDCSRIRYQWATDDDYWTYVNGAAQARFDYSDPGNLQHCDQIESRIDVTAVCDYGEFLENIGTANSRVNVTYQDPLAVETPQVTLQGSPGQTVTFNTSFSGGRGPYTVTSSLGATVTVSPQGSTLAYSYVIPAGARPTLTDTVSLSGQSTECGGDSATILVTIKVGPELSATPSPLVLPPGAPGETVEGSVTVSGGVPGYSANANVGETSTGGNTVTYRYPIPGDAPEGTIDAAITITDSAENPQSITVPVQITVSGPAAPPIAVTPSPLVLPPGAPGETVEGTLTVSGGVPGYTASANLGDASASGNTVTYRYAIPGDAAEGTIDDAVITITDSAENPQSITVPVQITVSGPITPTLSASPSPLVLPPGAPGDTVEGTLTVSGGMSGYTARANVGDASASGNTVTYRYAIPSDAPDGTVDAVITITDSAEVPQSITVPVQIAVSVPVAPPIAATPSPLELSALSRVGVEGEKTASFDVSGGTPPYFLSVASGGSGTVKPARLDTAGQATYAVAIPASSAAVVISDLVVITDSSGNRIELPVTVDVAASDTLSSRADLTPNERNVARAIETVCPQLGMMSSRTAEQEDLFQQCRQMLENSSSSGIPNTLEQVTTEKARASTSVAVETGNQQLANIGSRLAALRGGATGVSLQGFTLNVDGQPVPAQMAAGALASQLSGGAASGDSAFGRWGFFLNGSFNFGDKDTTENETGFDFSTTGVTAGADYRFSDQLVAGGAVGYARSDTTFDSDGGGLDTETWHLAAYGTYGWSERGYVDAIVEYGWQSYDSTRNIRYQIASDTGVVSRKAKADYDGTQFGASIGAGYDFDKGPLSYGLYGRAGYVQVDVDGYRERGASGLDLSLDDFDATSVTTTLGARVSQVFNTSWAVLVPQARAEWEHEYDQDADTLVARFAADPTATAFGIETDSPDRDYFRIGVGLSAVFPHGFSAFVNYDTVLDQQDWTDHLIDVGVRWELY